MWMSLMTSGVKICDRPRMYLPLSAGAVGSAASPLDVRRTGGFDFVATLAALFRTVTILRAANVLDFFCAIANSR
jgi:hypothetical protein